MQTTEYRVQNTDNRQITKQQIKLIHTLKSKLKLSDEEYRLRLSDYWVNTSKNLSYDEAEDFITKLKKEAIEKGVWTNRFNRSSRFNELAGREGMATPAQLRMIEAMWKKVSYTHDPAKRQSALRKILFRIAKVEDLRFLRSKDVSKIVNAFKNMRGGRHI
jgi:hypothetical protein